MQNKTKQRYGGWVLFANDDDDNGNNDVEFTICSACDDSTYDYSCESQI